MITSAKVASAVVSAGGCNADEVKTGEIRDLWRDQIFHEYRIGLGAVFFGCSQKDRSREKDSGGLGLRESGGSSYLTHAVFPLEKSYVMHQASVRCVWTLACLRIIG